MNKKEERRFRFSRLNDFSHSAMDWLGSVPSLIVHTLFFGLSFALIPFGVDANKVLLVVTTLVSLEAIYMAIFIQMAVNRNNESLDEMGADIDEIQEDVEDIQKDVDEIQEDIEEITEDEEEEDAAEEQNKIILAKIQNQLQIISQEIEAIKTKK